MSEKQVLHLGVEVIFVETSTFGAGFRAQTVGLDEVRCSTERVEPDFGLAATPGEALRWLADDVDREVVENGWRRIAVLNDRNHVHDEATEERRWDAAHGGGE